MDDISKIPRLPGDGAQDDPESDFNESPNNAQMRSGATPLRDSNSSCGQSTIQG